MGFRKHTTGDWKQDVPYLHPGISVSSLSGGTVSNVLAYFLAACRCACRASISFLVLGIRHLNMQHRVITDRERERMGHEEFIYRGHDSLRMGVCVCTFSAWETGGACISDMGDCGPCRMWNQKSILTLTYAHNFTFVPKCIPAGVFRMTHTHTRPEMEYWHQGLSRTLIIT